MKKNYYTKSFGSISASSRMLFTSFGCSVFEPWNGTVTLLPSAFLKILWLPLWRTHTNPCWRRTEIICVAVMRGSLGTVLHAYRNLYRRQNEVFRLPDLFCQSYSICKMKLNRVMDVCERILVRFALRVTSLQRRATDEIPRLVFFNKNREVISLSLRLHTAIQLHIKQKVNIHLSVRPILAGSRGILSTFARNGSVFGMAVRYNRGVEERFGVARREPRFGCASRYSVGFFYGETDRFFHTCIRTRWKTANYSKVSPCKTKERP